MFHSMMTRFLVWFFTRQGFVWTKVRQKFIYIPCIGYKAVYSQEIVSTANKGKVEFYKDFYFSMQKSFQAVCQHCKMKAKKDLREELEANHY